MARTVAWLVLGLGFGCGPAVVSDSGGAGETDTGGPATGDVSTGSTSTTTTTEPGTVGTSVGTSIGTSADETTTSDEESSSEGSPFIVAPDGGGVACSVLLICDVWAQDCPDGEKCVVYDGDGAPYLEGCVSLRCSPLHRDAAQPGETCTIEDGPWSGFDNCEIGSYCWDVDPDSLEGTCVANCQGSEANPVCAGGLTCFHGYDGNITACVSGCDALAPACADGSTCVTAQSGPSVCLPESLEIPAEQAIACDHSLGCGEGFACVVAAQVAGCEDPGSCCTALCDPAAPACDASVPVCTPLADDPTVGACTID